MKIQILGTDNMVPNGSYLLRSLQNESTPILELLVRESIQNSLDAGRHETSKFVHVKFNVGDFESHSLTTLLSEATKSLDAKYPNSTYKYLSIRDEGTSGLTGKLSKDLEKNNEYGNLVKLVYDFGKPQTNEGAGGSWGIGKTIFYRIGMGLVLYYSRIFNQETHVFESRFAACMIEDETKSNIIPNLDGESSRSGIAWWGDAVPGKTNKTQPLTDEEEISEILGIFNIPEYTGDETGTTVIIPYIDEDALLKHNAVQNQDEEDDSAQKGLPQVNTVPNWLNYMDMYLANAVQKWYYSRLNNKFYQYGKFLKVSVDNKLIHRDDMYPIFLSLQSLYNRAALRNQLPIGYEDYLSSKSVDIICSDINLQNYLQIGNGCSGTIAFVKLCDLDLDKDNYAYTPYDYIGIKNLSGVENSPILAFCREPGMVVAYAQSSGNNSEWLNKVPSTPSDQYIVAQFVLNSHNKLREGGSLEEYVRKSEMADHTSWNDHSNKKIIQRIQINTSSVIRNTFTEKPDRQNTRDGGLGTFVADLLLPPQGFGNNPNVDDDQTTERKPSKKGKKDLSVKFESTVYSEDSITLLYKIKSNTGKRAKVNTNLFISSVSGKLSFEDWENMLMKVPFDLSKVKIVITQLDSSKKILEYNISSEDSKIKDNLIKVRLVTSKNSGSVSGLDIEFNEPHIFEMSISYTISLYSREQQPIVVIS